ncbi:hypothetical protein JIX59_10670 [Brevundimonas diminuta]|uniref:hypothetical protein n=1 Tax=Brevundimonas diminuta TaxID=293 RepID=UPI001905862D|nr:hypothetical protein [Brevundimonas diminuta]MBK1969799.1 hypothetical protein [Brevundimonas diminuta]
MQVVSVLTYKSKDHLIRVGGSQAWRADRRRLRRAKYVVAARHAHGPYKAEGPELHKHAFLIGKISEVVDADIDGEAHDPDGTPRNKIMFSEYALIDGPELPLSGQNPVQYWDDLSVLNIDESKLQWQTVQPPVVLSPMERAKAIVAEAHGVTPSQVDITIRF